jgi:DNA-directed RNA polymerase specialized sigma24 family protein
VDDRESPVTGRVFLRVRDDGENVPTTKAVAVQREHQDIASRILAAMSARERDVLMRFYFHGQAADRIQADLGVTETEFRLIKSGAKARFAAGVQERGPRAVTRNRSAKLA